METNRLEAFSDGVIAIIITIMVLELKAPDGERLDALVAMVPSFLNYVLSFIYVGIYWNNHHHLLQVTQRVSGPVLWANLHLLFWLSLLPFATEWMGHKHFAASPTAAYGLVLFMAAVAYFVLEQVIKTSEGPGSVIEQALGRDWKGKASMALYGVAMALAFVVPWLAQAIYVLVALMWLVPDRRIERALAARGY
ncbi:MAG TPA: TMEM175 family protein [Aquabacterium sp.]|uniref:TMEM175 family protein n=1 Tax=Aquabacterium sp. TaxID=1872578 RepID=UPI002E356941|nr:TMEM175 family protein [Aquabacterium sp.]HEX5373619.1 TMEM175 family protein [Aquabacterium sp.]